MFIVPGKPYIFTSRDSEQWHTLFPVLRPTHAIGYLHPAIQIIITLYLPFYRQVFQGGKGCSYCPGDGSFLSKNSCPCKKNICQQTWDFTTCFHKTHNNISATIIYPNPRSWSSDNILQNHIPAECQTCLLGMLFKKGISSELTFNMI